MVLNTPSRQSCLLCPQSPPLLLLYSGDPSEVCLGWCSLCLDYPHRPLLVVGASGLRELGEFSLETIARLQTQLLHRGE